MEHTAARQHRAALLIDDRHAAARRHSASDDSAGNDSGAHGEEDSDWVSPPSGTPDQHDVQALPDDHGPERQPAA